MVVVTQAHDKGKIRDQPSIIEDKSIPTCIEDDNQDISMARTEDNQGVGTPSTPPFLRLPGELRNIIYKFITLDQPKSKWATYTDRRKFQLRGPSTPNALLSINRQITAEAWPFVYRYTMETETESTLQDALSEMGAVQRADLTDIAVLHAQPGGELARSAALLRDAAACLTTFYLDYFITTQYNRGRRILFDPEAYASHICEDMYPLLEKITRGRGIDAALSLVRFHEIDHAHRILFHPPSEREKEGMYESFREALRKCMMTRRKWKFEKLEDIFQGDAEEFKGLRLRSRVVTRSQK